MTQNKLRIVFATIILFANVVLIHSQELFEPDNINTKSNEYGLTFINKDWICFTRTIDKKSTLMFSKKENGKWGEPYVASFSGVSADEYASFDPLSNRLIFSSKRPVSDSSEPKRSNDLWYVELKEGQWSEPIHLKDNFSTEGIDSGGVSYKDLIYFHSDRSGRGLNSVDIYELKLNDSSASPKKLSINSDKVDGEAFIFNDGKAMLFMSGRSGSIGNSDIFLSVKNNNEWQEPVSIDTTGVINTDKWEYAPSLSPDNSELFFTRLVDGQADIYRIETSKISVLKTLLESKTTWAQRQIGKTPNYHFKGGLVFVGNKFVRKELYSSNGHISFNKPLKIDFTVSVENKYIIPPFGEAHNHNIEGDLHNEFAKKYIEDGIFYVKNPNSMPRIRPQNGRTKMIGTVDTVFANGGITSTDGHPNGLVKRNIERGIFRINEGDGGFVWLIDDIEDLDARWSVLLSARPDFIKTYLLYSEEYDKRKNDDSYFNRKGLDPKILKEIVKRAHNEGLRVSTHIETAVDFRNAIEADVDEINHMPGFRNLDNVPLDRFSISEKDAKMAAGKGIFVVTTLITDSNNPKIRQLHIDNLKTLKAANVPIALGSDVYRSNAKMEADFIYSLKIFTNLELLKIWCENTVATIYPNRKIGKLIEGYESNFLVLEGDPIDKFKNTEKISLRVKQGLIISEVADVNFN